MIYVHIGLAKTGSTSIQRFLSMNPDLLARHGITYPEKWRRVVSHHEIFHAIQSPQGTDVLDDFYSDASTNPDHKFVISAESLSKATDEQIRFFAERATRDLPVQVVIYVRDLRDWVVSVYNQRAKRFTTIKNFDEHFTSVTKHGRIELSSIAKRWANQFGSDNIRVRTLASDDLSGGTLLTDVCDWLNLPQEVLGEADPDSVERRNEGTWWEIAEYVRAMGVRLQAIAAQMDPEEFANLQNAGQLKSRPARESAKGDSPGKLRISRAAEACLTGLNAAGLESQPVQYLTIEQNRILGEQYTEELSAIRSSVSNAVVTVREQAALSRERPFLPSLEHVPREYVDAMNAGIRAKMSLKQMPASVRKVLKTMGD